MNTTPKNRSYTTRSRIAEATGRPLHHDLSFREGEVAVSTATIDGWLLSTSNAGFRGIECSILTEDGERRHGVSLGDVEAFHITATDDQFTVEV